MQNIGWKDWTKDNGFYIDKYSDDNCFVFKLKENARVLTITNSEQLKGLPQVDIGIDMGFVLLDFEKLKKQYDAIEVLISKDTNNSDFMEGLYWVLYGWDCDSILILNKDIVLEV